MAAFEVKEAYTLHDLVLLVEALRDPLDGCPWDKVQTHDSIRQNFLEETYEVLEAIDNGNKDQLLEELGDVLLQVVLHAEIERQDGGFDIDGVADRICKKLVLRHPHIFGEIQADNPDQVLGNWEQIKRQEKHQKSGTDAIADVPLALPALMRSQKVQKRAGYVGFDYDGIDGAMHDLESEVEELKQAIAESSNVEEELGDLLFAAVNVARFAKLDAELSLKRACDKFAKRFARVEQLALAGGIDMQQAGMDKLDALWKQAKEVSSAQVTAEFNQ